MLLSLNIIVYIPKVDRMNTSSRVTFLSLMMKVIQFVMFQSAKCENGRSQKESQYPNKKDSSCSSDSSENILRRKDDQLVAIKCDDCNRYGRNEDGHGLEPTSSFTAPLRVAKRPMTIDHLDEGEWHRDQTKEKIRDC